MRRRVLGTLLALCLLAGLLPGAALAWEREDGLPEGAELLEESPPLPEAGGAAGQTDYLVRSLRLEAGQRTAEIDVTARTACTLWAALYGGDGRLLDAAASRAQAGDSTVRVSFSVRAPEGFTARAFLLDKDGRPLCESRRAGTYSIDSLRLEDGMVRAGVTAAGSCTLRVRFRGEEGGSTLEEAALPVSGSPEQEAVEAEMPEGLPQYFLLEAQLVDGASKALCGLYTDRTHTRAYQASVSKTPQDYPAERVLDFGDSGFAVLPQGTRRAGEAQETAGGYTVPAMPALPSPGEVVALDVDGATVPVKVKSASSRDGKTVIVPDENASLADLYDSLRVDATVELGSAGQTARAGGGGGSHEPHVNLNATFPVNRNVTLVSTGTMCLKVHTYFDKAADPEYVEQSKLLIGEGTLSLISEGELSTEMIKDALALEIAETPTLPLGTTGLGATIKVSLPLAFNITPQSRIDAHYTLYMGDTYRAGAGFQKVDESSFEIDRPNLKTAVKSVSASLGLQGSLTLGGVVPTIPLEASLDYQVGGRFASEQDLDKESGTVKHACQFCCRERVSVFQELGASFSCDLGKINIPLAKLTVPLVEKNLVQGYHSYRNDPDSPLKGRNTLGSGECPNKQYLVSVSARDTAGSPVSGMEAAAANQATGKTVTGTIPCSLWLYANQHIISAEIGGRTCKLYFTPSAENRTAELRPQPVTLITWVRDRAKGSYLKGASVTVTDISDPDHPRETGRGTTDDRGYFDLRLLPGVYRVAASMEDYQDASQTVAITGGAPDPVELALERERAYAALTVSVIDGEGNPVSAYVTFKSDEYTTMTATGAAGTVTQKFLPPGTYTVSVPATGGYPAASRTVTLEPGEEGSVTITVASGSGALKGTVTDGDGGVLSGASINVSQDGKTVKTATTDSGGGYSMDLPAGTYTVTASASGWAAQRAEVTILKDQTTARDFILGGTGTLKIAALTCLGKVIDKPAITVTASDGEVHHWGSHPMTGDQIYTFGGLPVGICQITASPEGYLPKTVEVTVEKGKTLTVWIVVHKGDIQWSLDEDTGTLTISGTGKMDDYRINGIYPDYVSYPPPWYSERDSITSVVVEEGVTGIGNQAFINHQSLTSLSLPSTLSEIGDSAFAYDAALPDAAFPEGLTALGDSAFCGCEALSAVTVPGSVTLIGAKVFSGCSQLTRATLLNGIDRVGDSMFSSCVKLTDVSIPSSVTNIGPHAFYGCTSLENVALPGNVTTIGNRAFRECTALKGMVLPNGVTSIGECAFIDCAALASIGIPDSVASIGKGAFSGCTALAGVTIPDHVASIGNEAFINCAALTGIAIPDSVTELGYGAFSGCSALTWASVGDNLTALPDSAFSECTNLESVRLGERLESIGDAAFYNCKALEEIAIPNSVKAIGGKLKYYESHGTWNNNGAFQSCVHLKRVTVPAGLETIGDRAFEGCMELLDFVFPSSLRSIGIQAFNGCALEEVILPDSVTELGRSTFAGCEELKDIRLPRGITLIPTSLLSRCSSLWSVSIPEGVAAIADSVFDGCSSLHSIYLPESLERIEKCTHWDYYYGTQRNFNFLHECESIQTICYAGTEAQWANVEIGMPDSFPENVRVSFGTPSYA